MKRTFDVLFAFIGLSVTLPLLAGLAILVRIESTGNPFFMQRRVGLNGKQFTLFKLRSLFLKDFGVDVESELSLNDRRITRVGRLLRRSKLDELPQLLNVLLGHMSIVGPRPDIPEQVANYTFEQRQRLRVRPGLTGAAQVCGNTAMSWSQRIRIDNWYIDNQSIGLDLRILLATASAISTGEKYIVNRLNIPAAVLAGVNERLVDASDDAMECRA